MQVFWVKTAIRLKQDVVLVRLLIVITLECFMVVRALNQDLATQKADFLSCSSITIEGDFQYICSLKFIH